MKDACIAWLNGAQSARNPQAEPELLEVWTKEQKNAYLEGFAAMRKHMSRTLEQLKVAA